jgi:N-acetylglutamate synthase-like GNAT family acetyltransferase
MYFLFKWFRCLLRTENIKAIIGGLKRRMLGLDYLEMRVALNNGIMKPSILGKKLEIRRYSGELKKECIDLLNDVASIGPWNQSSFQQKILDTVENPKSDIFVVFMAKSVVGFAVIHKKSLSDNSAEIGYVVIKSGSRGKKLGYKLLVYILSEMRRRGISYAYVRTDSFRIPAIKTYLKCGFCPYIKNGNDRKRWQDVMDKIGIDLADYTKTDKCKIG